MFAITNRTGTFQLPVVFYNFFLLGSVEHFSYKIHYHKRKNPRLQAVETSATINNSPIQGRHSLWVNHIPPIINPVFKPVTELSLLVFSSEETSIF